jgi:uncharacterized protein (TIGR02466 family)
MTNKFSILPLFPTTLGAVTVSEDLSNLEKVKDFVYTDITSDESFNSFKTEDNQLLLNFPKEKEILLSYFNNFKNDVLALKDNEFAISSSWATRVEPNGFCQSHDHKNSYYSGVLYLDSVSAGGEILFQNPVPTGSFLLNPVEWNSFNFETYQLTAKKNLLLLFPSYLKHRINKYLGTESRYSIAFNIVPIGKFGRGDSIVNYQLIE